MLVKYRPEGQQEPTEWAFDPKLVRESEAELIEEHMPAGTTYQQWVALVQSGKARARRVLLWYLQRRDHPSLRYEDTPDFFFGELEVDYSIDDLHQLRQQIVDSSVAESEKAEILARLDVELGQKQEKAAAKSSGKAPSKRAASGS